jgi:peptide/nickel transport system substrate-binding protein
LEVGIDGRVIGLGGHRQRAVLAVLLLHPNQRVSSDRLIDEVWDGRPPAEATQSLQSYISRLRRLLGDSAPIIAQSDGYLIAVDASQLDVVQFRALVDQGHQALRDGHYYEAGNLLREALALWRGEPLADLDEESFVREPASEWSQLRLMALGDRIEADIERGQAEAVIGELDGLVAHYPHTERFCELQMRALYLAGRQVDALAAYRAARDTLVDRFGIEPSERLRNVERAILAHDPSLAAAAARTDGRSGRPETVGAALSANGQVVPLEAPTAIRRRPVAFALAAVGAAAAIAALAAVMVARSASGNARWPSGGEKLGVLSSSGGLRRAISLDGVANAVLQARSGDVWSADQSAGQVSMVDPGGRVTTVAIGGSPSALAISDGIVWAADSGGRDLVRLASSHPRVLDRPDVCNGPDGLAAGDGSIWVACALDGTLLQIDPRSARVRQTVDVGQSPTAVCLAGHSVWVSLESDDKVAAYDPQLHSLVRIGVGQGPFAIAHSGEFIWVANRVDQTLSRISTTTDTVTAIVPLSASPTGLAAAGNGGVWAALADGHMVLAGGSPIRVERTESLPGTPYAVTGARTGGLLVSVGPPLSSVRGGTVRYYSLAGLTESLDPAINYDSAGVQTLNLTNDGLLAFRRQGGPLGETLVPDLARALPVEADNGSLWTFRLRSGIRYADGQPVRPSDLRYAIERDLQAGSPGAPLYQDILGAANCAAGKPCNLARGIVISGSQISFRLTQSDPDLPYKLALPFADAVPVRWPLPGKGALPPATGPYQVARFVTNRLVVAVRNPHFHPWSLDGQPPGIPDRIIERFISSPAHLLALIRERKVDIAELDSGPMLRTVSREAPGSIVSASLGATSWIALNTRRPPLTDVRVRRAVADAIDRQAVSRLYSGSSPSCQILPPGFPGYAPFCPYTVSPGTTWHAPNLQTARRLVRNAGAVGDTLTLLVLAGYPSEAQPWSRALRAIGLHLHVERTSAANAFRALDQSPAHWSMTSYGWTADYPSPSDFFQEIFSCRSFVPHSTSNRNISEFCSHHIDRLMATASAAELSDPARADRLWAAVDRAVTLAAPVVPETSYGEVDYVSPRVAGFAISPQYANLLGQVSIR